MRQGCRNGLIAARASGLIETSVLSQRLYSLVITITIHIIMQASPCPAEQAEAAIQRAVMVCRKAAKRSLPWDLPVDKLELVSPQQAEYPSDEAAET
jgi:hypothetical protein